MADSNLSKLAALRASQATPKAAAPTQPAAPAQPNLAARLSAQTAKVDMPSNAPPMLSAGQNKPAAKVTPPPLPTAAAPASLVTPKAPPPLPSTPSAPPVPKMSSAALSASVLPKPVAPPVETVKPAPTEPPQLLSSINAAKTAQPAAGPASNSPFKEDPTAPPMLSVASTLSPKPPEVKAEKPAPPPSPPPTVDRTLPPAGQYTSSAALMGKVLTNPSPGPAVNIPAPTQSSADLMKKHLQNPTGAQKSDPAPTQPQAAAPKAPPPLLSQKIAVDKIQAAANDEQPGSAAPPPAVKAPVTLTVPPAPSVKAASVESKIDAEQPGSPAPNPAAAAPKPPPTVLRPSQPKEGQPSVNAQSQPSAPAHVNPAAAVPSSASPVSASKGLDSGIKVVDKTNITVEHKTNIQIEAKADIQINLNPAAQPAPAKSEPVTKPSMRERFNQWRMGSQIEGAVKANEKQQPSQPQANASASKALSTPPPTVMQNVQQSIQQKPIAQMQPTPAKTSPPVSPSQPVAAAQSSGSGPVSARADKRVAIALAELGGLPKGPEAPDTRPPAVQLKEVKEEIAHIRAESKNFNVGSNLGVDGKMNAARQHAIAQLETKQKALESAGVKAEVKSTGPTQPTPAKATPPPLPPRPAPSQVKAAISSQSASAKTEPAAPKATTPTPTQKAQQPTQAAPKATTPTPTQKAQQPTQAAPKATAPAPTPKAQQPPQPKASTPAAPQKPTPTAQQSAKPKAPAPVASKPPAPAPQGASLNKEDLANFHQVLLNKQFNMKNLGKAISVQDGQIKITANSFSSKDVRAGLAAQLGLNSSDFQKVKKGIFTRMASALGMAKDEYLINPAKLKGAMEQARAQRYVHQNLANQGMNLESYSLKLEGNQLQIKANRFSGLSGDDIEKKLLASGLDSSDFTRKRNSLGKDEFTINVGQDKLGKINEAMAKPIGINPSSLSQNSSANSAPTPPKSSSNINLDSLAAKNWQTRKASMNGNGQAAPAALTAHDKAEAVGREMSHNMSLHITKMRKMPGKWEYGQGDGTFVPPDDDLERKKPILKVQVSTQENLARLYLKVDGNPKEQVAKLNKALPANSKCKFEVAKENTALGQVYMQSTDKTSGKSKDEKLHSMCEPLNRAIIDSNLGTQQVPRDRLQAKMDKANDKTEQRKHHHSPGMKPHP